MSCRSLWWSVQPAGKQRQIVYKALSWNQRSFRSLLWYLLDWYSHWELIGLKVVVTSIAECVAFVDSWIVSPPCKQLQWRSECVAFIDSWVVSPPGKQLQWRSECVAFIDSWIVSPPGKQLHVSRSSTRGSDLRLVNNSFVVTAEETK
jgi:hypothetical protein